MNTCAGVLVVVLMAMHLTGHAVSGVTFELPDKQETCFYQDFDADERYIVQYNVIRGGKLDVDVTISNPRGTSIYKKNKRRQDTVRFQTEKGKYSFCFGNKFSTVTHKLIFFNMRSENPESQAAKLGDKTYRVNTKFEEYFEKVFQYCNEVIQFQTHYRINEARGRFAAEELNVRVQWWSLAQALVVLCSGLGQVLVLKTFFSERQKPRSHSMGHSTPMSMPTNSMI